MKMHKSLLIIGLIGVFLTTGLAGNVWAKEKTAELAYVEWSCATASVHVVIAVLNEKMGYDAEATPVSAAAMWQATASGDVDGFTTAWLPTTHGHYYDKVKDDVVNLGHNCTGTRIGLVVPTYVTIDSITELNAHADKFDGQITGIDPGAGIMSKTEEAIEKYGMSDMTLMEGSGAMMTAVLKDKIRNNEWVVVTGWTPHWKFGRWDLKYLEDPKGIYGGEEYIDTVVRSGLKEDDPDLYALLDNFEWGLADIHEVMNMNTQSGTTPYENAVKWVNANEDKVNAWLPDSYK